jgi:cell wall-associated NlpC family hydrolase
VHWKLDRHIRAVVVIAVIAVLAAAAAAFAVPKITGGSQSSADKLADVKLAPKPWAADPQYRPGAQSPTTTTTTTTTTEAKPVPKAPVDPKTGLPAASAGTNGSFTVPSPAERKRVYTATHPVGGNDSALLLNRTALAPPSAPDPIRAMISAANLIVGQPYVWGGGHASFQSKGYDCSGAVSYALAGAGLLQTPMTSGAFMGYGAPGPGQWLTIYASPTHVYAVIAGLRWDTVGDARGSGPRWHPYDAYPQGFVARHVPGL